jgi:hypothetical protein
MSNSLSCLFPNPLTLTNLLLGIIILLLILILVAILCI